MGACLVMNHTEMLSNSEGVPYILFAQATKGNQSKSFYTMPEYESWCEGVNTSGWKIKYYKGLGTSTDEEAQEYFADIDRHRKRFVWNGKPQLPATALSAFCPTLCKESFISSDSILPDSSAFCHRIVTSKLHAENGSKQQCL